MAFVVLAAGLALLIAGGDVLVRGASGIARAFKIPPLIIGLTIVAFGTSVPELVVAIEAVLKGAPDIVTGNVVGSNIANIMLVLAIAALIAPIRTDLHMINRDGMVMVAASAVLAGLALTGLVGFWAGLAMVLTYLGYIAYSSWDEYRAANNAGGMVAASDDTPARLSPAAALVVDILLFIAGVAGVIAGADLLVSSATGIARGFGLSEAVIGLTMVAVGTSLPELAACGMAALRGKSEIALGNVIGSNIANILFVLGAAGLVKPVTVAAQIVRFDVWVMLAVAIILIPLMVTGRTLSRMEGAVFAALYVLYVWALYADLPMRLLG